MYEQVSTGPLYDKAVQLLSTYRSVAARMGNARSSTQGKLDRRLEQMSERISEALGELTDNELMALDCWRDGVLPGLYEVDHTAIVEKPYVSIRKILRWTEEHDVATNSIAKRDSTLNSVFIVQIFNDYSKFNKQFSTMLGVERF